MAQIAAEDLFALSIPERIQLVEDIWDSIATCPEQVILTSTVKEELDKRLEEYAQNPQDQSSWGDVRTRLWRLV
jgi:putative addiction module component (TIGR02574 family)